MIADFCEKFANKKDTIASYIKELGTGAHYGSILEVTLKAMFEEEEEYYGLPNWNNIHTIDDGHYQGTLVFLVPANTYQPHAYWYTMVDYGSCSYCDTLGSIVDYGSGPLTDEQVGDLVTLAMHMIQNMRKMYDGEAGK